MTVKPISAHNRPRSRCQASPTVMLAPNTARPTTTVSMPLSRIDDSQVATAAGQARRRRADQDARRQLVTGLAGQCRREFAADGERANGQDEAEQLRRDHHDRG